MAYIGQSNTLAGAAAAERIVKSCEGRLVGMVIGRQGWGSADGTKLVAVADPG